jgi:lipopolysaccharide/colanic/teichoic acid biosynthesis glycosyltransferase/glycosyltransferase involved in cell wall biosynthesis
MKPTPMNASPRPITVLHLLKTSVGASWALRQMRELVKLGVRVHAAMPAGPLVSRYRAAGIVVHEAQLDLPVRRPWRIPATLRTMRDLVDCVRPDLIHSHFVGTTLTMRLALGRRHTTPRLFQVPGPLHLEHSFFRKMELATAGPRDHWMGSCRWTCDCYRGQGVPGDRIWLSYYGIDLAELEPAAPGKLRRELGLSADTPIVGMVAFMYPPKRYLGQRRGLKGHEDLIDAIALLAGRRPQLRCVIIGGAWNGAVGYEARVRAYAKKRCGDRVIILGTRADVAELYPDLDVVVHPSHSENVGGAAESLLLAVPTVATNVGGFPDLVRDGDTGWLVPPKDPAALARAIDEALSDPAEGRRRARNGQELARQIIDLQGTVRDVCTSYEQLLGREQLPVAERPTAPTFYRRHGKRAFDAVLSGCALALLAPILAAIALLVRVRLGSPVLFRQQRPGLRGKPFLLMKFRTMTDRRDAGGALLPDGERLTPIGRLLRSTSLDELPELLNVLLGDMSLVGPRPLLREYLPLYTDRQARRHEVEPGITGLAQVRGRNALSWEEKFELDVRYVESASLFLDVKILMMTMITVLQRQGISSEGHATAPEFVGSHGHE